MGENYLTIGQMAELNHVSTQTLRLYDRKGLLKPEYQDPQNGYRYYHIAQSDELDLIHTMKICGMTLEEIQKQLTESSQKELYESLIEQEKKLSKEIYKLTRSLYTIRRFTSNLNLLNSLPPIGKIIYEYLPERRIDTFTSNIDFFEKGYSGYEEMIREFKSYMIENELPLSYFFNAGTLIEKDDFSKQKLKSNTVFIFVDDDYPESKTQRILPENMYITIYADDTSKEYQYAKEIYSEIKKVGYEIAGEYLCEVILYTPYNKKEKKYMKYKLQVPVTHKNRK
ncbi:MerR family transcriptional regulator [Clostridium sp. HCS.1]|uniref:MerR family transcriptional regulator n=1 Tax=Clostridium sp. HCS.1 TaxID=3238594 RepID=UPI003A0FD75F